MKIFALDSSATAASVAIAEDDKLICEYTVNVALTHSQTLMPMVESVFTSAGLACGDMDLFACTIGPGSFTGLRIGVAALKSLAYAVGKPAVGVSTLKALALGLPYCPHLICPIMDARRGQVYNALYRWDGDALTELAAPRALAIEALTPELTQDVVFVGDGVPVHRAYLEEVLGEAAHFAPVNAGLARASSIALGAREETPLLAQDLNPVYLRLSQAEREYLEKHPESK